MKNVTITLDEEVARWARLLAAEREMSVSRFVGALVRERMDRDREYEAAMHRNLGRRPRPLKKRGTYPARAEIHDRDVLRR